MLKTDWTVLRSKQCSSYSPKHWLQDHCWILMMQSIPEAKTMFAPEFQAQIPTTLLDPCDSHMHLIPQQSRCSCSDNSHQTATSCSVTVYTLQFLMQTSALLDPWDNPCDWFLSCIDAWVQSKVKSKTVNRCLRSGDWISLGCPFLAELLEAL